MPDQQVTSSAEHTSKAASSNEVGADSEYFYGFDMEHMQAYRSRPGNKAKTHSISVEEPEHAEETDPVIGVWDDGHRARISDFTVGELRAHQEPTFLVKLGLRWVSPESWGKKHMFLL